ncbi:hypothetical protein QYF36_007242 [Acer negundo]|nr:hypothetical protein QYF36_007242 [Acer negundo]
MTEILKSTLIMNLGLNGSTGPESFKACVPLVTHKDLEPYIQRIADSDTSPILTGKAITTISLRYFLCFVSWIQIFKRIAKEENDNLWRAAKEEIVEAKTSFEGFAIAVKLG